MKQLMKVKFGSHLYGTATENSDTDYKGVHIPSSYNILLQKADEVVSKSIKNSDSIKNTSDDVDDESFSILKFMKMIQRGDMVATELLFVPKDKLIIDSEDWQYIVKSKHKLISRNISGFIGYIRKQVSMYGIKGFRVSTVRSVKEFLEHQNQKEKLGNIDLSQLNGLPHIYKGTLESSNVLIKYIEVVNRKLPFTLKVSEALSIINKIFDNYGHRALAAERNEGIDWKSFAHAHRVSEQAIELLEHGYITFPRPNADKLLKIRNAEYDYNEMAQILENNLSFLENLSKTSEHFSDEVDEKFIKDIICNFHRKMI